MASRLGELEAAGIRRRSTRVGGVFALALALVAAGAVGQARAELSGKAHLAHRLGAPGPVTELELTALNGAVHVVAGTVFSAAVDVTVSAESQALAEELLGRAKPVLEFHDGHARLTTPGPSDDQTRGRGKWNIETRYEVTLPAQAALRTKVVNAGIDVAGITGSLKLDSVNGAVVVGGGGNEVGLHSVNGKIEASFAKLSPSAHISAETVNGPVRLWFPPDAHIKVTAASLNGELVTSLPLPPREEPARWGPRRQRYEGATDANGASIKANTVNGRVALLGIGTDESAVRPLVVTVAADRGGRSLRKARALTDATPGRAGAGDEAEGDVDVDDDVHRQVVQGDFVLLGRAGDVRADSVSGGARVRTTGGDVRLGAVGLNADVETQGGDVRVDAARGDVRVRTAGGDVRIDAVAGNARLETEGGDILVAACNGRVDAVTAGGDVLLRRVHGGVKASTQGGDIAVESLSKQVAAGIELASEGGDVTVTLPANFQADVNVVAVTTDRNNDHIDRHIRSDFRELDLTAQAGTFRAQGKLGAGGPKLTIHTTGGTITLKKAPPI